MQFILSVKNIHHDHLTMRNQLQSLTRDFNHYIIQYFQSKIDFLSLINVRPFCQCNIILKIALLQFA